MSNGAVTCSGKNKQALLLTFRLKTKLSASFTQILLFVEEGRLGADSKHQTILAGTIVKDLVDQSNINIVSKPQP